MSWMTILVAAASAYFFKLVGFAWLSRFDATPHINRIIRVTPAALFAAIVVTQLVANSDWRLISTRIVGVTAASLCVWRKAPLVVVIVVAAVSTAMLRAAW